MQTNKNLVNCREDGTHLAIVMRDMVKRTTATKTVAAVRQIPYSAKRCRAKFLHYFPDGFQDESYIAWEREHKERANIRWSEDLSRREFQRLLIAGQFDEIARRAIRIESRTNLLFSFEKMALRDAIRSPAAVREFSQGLFDFLEGKASVRTRFNRWVEVVSKLPAKKSRVFTWPVATVFGFVARPGLHYFMKPTITQRAAKAYGVDILYTARPTWNSYQSVLFFCQNVMRDLRDLHPRDMIDIQSFLCVQGSDDYP